jgi:hypothetical protein
MKGKLMSNLSLAANPEGAWTRFWRLLSRFDEALSVREVDILQRRVGRLEEQVAELRSKIADSAAGATTVADDRKSH